ncbi:hypothetical protein CN271_00165 [Bacillus cereus]|uniref:nucleotidyltransferase domain-containing protein n=1 Tax=Bacillus cereus TaxID=1396 RepID=UPI000BED01C3|nr:nucleotidyltransferase domain-containing protein [Bacillus cereus]PEE32423.1 hypothetical protein CON59_31180 [Bacillus cereus]PET45259.1 hypothetical protein CN523_16525 [Bacillus cereus]PEV66259.1 hypothetical protein CN429_31845 [Bacillus cereus]PFA36688.1 hypothetical protein CN389_31915 [Bacillus cereus]PFD81123.1 hypothetical protein CN271_00165 [Bacillus cereus]
MDNILKQIIEILSSYSGVIKVVLFGSRANLTNKTYSDYDIAFETEYMTDKEINILIINTLDRVETLHKIDLIHINSVTNKELLQNIKGFGKVLYQKDSGAKFSE